MNATFKAKGFLFAASLVALLIVLGVTQIDFFGWLFNEKFLPHAYCYLNKPGLVWTHVASDATIAFAYLAISTILTLLVYRARADLPFGWIFLAFGLFIVACGVTHAMEVVTTWMPLYVLSAGIKVFTATVSVITAVALHFQVPKILSLIHSVKFSESRIEALHAAEKERDHAQEILRTYRQNLESMISQRTGELAESVRRLTLELEQRK